MQEKCSPFFLLNLVSTFLSDQCSNGVLFQVISLILLELTPARLQPASVKRASRLWIMWLLTGSAVSENRETCHAFILCTSGQAIKRLLYLVAVMKVLICFLWYDAVCHLALRIPFQPKGLKHHVLAASFFFFFFTSRRNIRCYHDVPSERWQWDFYRDQWDSYIIPHCDLFLHFCALETRWLICDCGVL